ncbi:hypothetical protein [Morganella morganii IS15]|nr:hypothetical protein CSB69_3175 [Morganella morganii]EMP53394.1 hypothetical protein C790_01585 [Morganella morganii SC01]CDK64947.1 hypothetical protein [Morganella morganii IS15]
MKNRLLTLRLLLLSNFTLLLSVDQTKASRQTGFLSSEEYHND